MPHITFRNKEIFYRVSGKGTPVMLLHGFGEDSEIWKHQLTHLKESYKVIVPDLPGSGQSEMLEGKPSIEEYAEIINAIMEGAEVTNDSDYFTLIGHSMGGYIALAYARKYGDRLKALGLFHSSAFADNDEKISTRKKSIEFIKENGAAAFLKTSVPNLFADQTKENNPELVEELLISANRISAEALIQYTEAMINRKDTTAELADFSGAVLMIIGKYDAAIPLETSLKQCAIPAIASIHILQHSGHIGMWEETSLSNIYLANFLQSFA